MKKVMQTGTYYTILHNEDATFTPWIVCSGYDKDSGTWAQGHYFQNMMEAVEFFQAAEAPASEAEEEPEEDGPDYETLARRIATKVRICQAEFSDPDNGYQDNRRRFPFYSEWKGIEQAMKALGINYDYEYDKDYEVTAVIVEGERVETTPHLIAVNI